MTNAYDKIARNAINIKNVKIKAKLKYYQN